MKFKVKGLVFVGFAAAILSANAMAVPAATTDANTVTSKAFTEATYQKKVGGGTNASKLVQATEEAGTVSYVEIGNNQSDVANGVTKVVTGNAVAAALAQNGGTVENGTLSITVNNTTETFTANQSGDTTFSITGLEETANKLDGTTGKTIADYANDATKYPSAKAVADAISASETATQYTGQQDTTVDNTNHTITTVIPVKGVQVNGGDLTPDATTKKVNVTVAPGTTAGTIAVNGTDVAVTNAEVTTNKLAQGEATGNVITNQATDAQYPSALAVYNAIAASESATTYTSDDTTITKTGNQFSANTAAINGTSAQSTLTTGGQVYDYVQSKTNGLTLPAKPSTCTDSTPCALVSDDTDGMAWKPIAQPND